MALGTHVVPEPKAPDDSESELDLRDLLAQIRAKIWFIAALTVVAAIIGTFFGQIPPSVFRSSTVLQIEQRADRIVLPEELIGNLLTGNLSGSSGLATEAHIIRSRIVLEPIIDDLDLRTEVAPQLLPFVGGVFYQRNIPFVSQFLPKQYARPGEFLEAALDVPDARAGARYIVRITGDGVFSVETPDNDLVQGQVGQRLGLPGGGSLLVEDFKAASGRMFYVSRSPLRNTVASIAERLGIRERDNTGIVDFSLTGLDGPETVVVLNAIVQEYIYQNLLRSSEEIDNSLEFIEEQLDESRRESKRATDALAEFRRDRQVNELSADTQQLLENALELEGQLEEVQFRKEQLLLVLTENHPDVQQLVVQEARLQERLQEAASGLSVVPEFEQELARLVARVERSQMLEQQLLARLEQLGILKASTVSNIRVLEPAEVAAWAGPDRRMPIVFGAVIGLALAVALVLGRNFFRQGIEDAREIEALGIPLFATIGKSELLVGKAASSPEYGLALFQPNDMAVEALRGLRTGLKFALGSSGSNSIMITSCAPADGKSFVSLNLALLYGQMGARVLLIDADMRRGFLRRYFKVEKKHLGLSDFLSGTTEHCIEHFPKEKIDVLFSGQFPPNPAELLENPNFDDLLTTAEEFYDIVIVDAPPSLSVSDPTIIGQKVGMSMLVARHLVTTPGDIQAAIKTLTTSGVKLSGVILNQYDESRSRYGRYGGKYYYSYGGYKYAYKTDKASK